jgi:hypothetical protein
MYTLLIVHSCIIDYSIIGLVCARHLVHFGYRPTIYYPKPGRHQLFQVGNMIDLCSQLLIKLTLATGATMSQSINSYS